MASRDDWDKLAEDELKGKKLNELQKIAKLCGNTEIADDESYDFSALAEVHNEGDDEEDPMEPVALNLGKEEAA